MTMKFGTTDKRTFRLALPLAIPLLPLLAACGGGVPEGAASDETQTQPSAADAVTEREATQEAGPESQSNPRQPTQTPTVEEDAELDRAALVALYEATGGASWTDNGGWVSDSPIGQWYGVVVDDSGRVTALALDGNNLVGTVPPELRTLTALTRLDLGGNRLEGCLPANLQDQLDVRVDLLALGRDPNPPPTQTSAETDKDALVAIFNATHGPGWDTSGTWAGRLPIGKWAGVTTGPPIG